MIIGHSAIVRHFALLQSAGALGHAYCFAGASSLGKRAVAEKIAADILQVAVSEVRKHPDFFLVERGFDAKTGKRKRDITVEQARELRTRLQESAWKATGKQVAIVDGAEYLNEGAGNALLKVLEEPPADAVVFLITQDLESVLPTIRSRASCFQFSLVPEGEILVGLKNMFPPDSDFHSAITYAQGRPGCAVAYLADENVRQAYTAAMAEINGLWRQPAYVKMKAIDALIGDAGESEEGRDALSERLDLWLNVVRSGMVSESAGERYAFLDRCLEAKRLLRKNIQPRLIFDYTLLPF